MTRASGNGQLDATSEQKAAPDVRLGKAVAGKFSVLNTIEGRRSIAIVFLRHRYCH